MRTILEADIIAIKGATEASYVHGGGVTSLPAFTRVNVSTLSKYASVTRTIEAGGSSALEYSDKVIPVDIAIEADRRAKHPWIIAEAARQLGYELVPISDPLKPVQPISERDAHVILTEAMDVSRMLISAFDDGRIDALERKMLRTELRELIATAQRSLDSLQEE